MNKALPELKWIDIVSVTVYMIGREFYATKSGSDGRHWNKGRPKITNVSSE